MNGRETSIKQLFQGMMSGEAPELMEGTVISASPLKIQMTNDEKLIVTDRITVVPRHLSDYEVTADISGGSVTGTVSGGGSVTSLTQTGCKIKVKNALKKGERVLVLALNHGKLYYVLDRVVNDG